MNAEREGIVNPLEKCFFNPGKEEDGLFLMRGVLKANCSRSGKTIFSPSHLNAVIFFGGASSGCLSLERELEELRVARVRPQLNPDCCVRSHGDSLIHSDTINNHTLMGNLSGSRSMFLHSRWRIPDEKDATPIHHRASKHGWLPIRRVLPKAPHANLPRTQANGNQENPDNPISKQQKPYILPKLAIQGSIDFY